MNTVLQTFIKLLLAISLAVTPVFITLASASNAANDLAAHTEKTTTCHDAGNADNTMPMLAAVTVHNDCCGDDCDCIDTSACYHAPSPHMTMLLTSASVNAAINRASLLSPRAERFCSLSYPPVPPPPLS